MIVASLNVNECPICHGSGYVLNCGGQAVRILADREVCKRCDGRGILDTVWEKGYGLSRKKLGSQPSLRRKRLGLVNFDCPNCARKHQAYFIDYPSEPSTHGVTCGCGAELVVIGEPNDFDVLWMNQAPMQEQGWLRYKPKLKAGCGGYFDLVRVPHGHVPAGKVFLWGRLPILVREIRGNDYFKCPECGAPSFFKVSAGGCNRCLSPPAVVVGDGRLRWLRERRCNYFRGLWKTLEVLVLPFLVVTGKAWYVYSRRKRWQRS